MAKLVDALDLGSSGEIHGGSSPSMPTILCVYDAFKNSGNRKNTIQHKYSKYTILYVENFISNSKFLGRKDAPPIKIVGVYICVEV